MASFLAKAPAIVVQVRSDQPNQSHPKFTVSRKERLRLEGGGHCAARVQNIGQTRTGTQQGGGSFCVVVLVNRRDQAPSFLIPSQQQTLTPISATDSRTEQLERTMASAHPPSKFTRRETLGERKFVQNAAQSVVGNTRIHCICRWESEDVPKIGQRDKKN